MTNQDFTPISKPRVKHAPLSSKELRALCEAAPDHMLRNGSDQDNARRFYNSVRAALPDLLDKADRLDAMEAGSFDLQEGNARSIYSVMQEEFLKSPYGRFEDNGFWVSVSRKMSRAISYAPADTLHRQAAIDAGRRIEAEASAKQFEELRLSIEAKDREIEGLRKNIDVVAQQREAFRRGQDEARAEIERQGAVVREAYGHLWQIETDDARFHKARRLVLSLIDKEGQREGIANTRPLDCGHPIALAINSAETGEFLYCELCNTRSERNDAVLCETELRASLATAEARLAAMRTALEDTQSLLAAMLHEVRPTSEIEEQMVTNHRILEAFVAEKPKGGLERTYRDQFDPREPPSSGEIFIEEPSTSAPQSHDQACGAESDAAFVERASKWGFCTTDPEARRLISIARRAIALDDTIAQIKAMQDVALKSRALYDETTDAPHWQFWRGACTFLTNVLALLERGPLDVKLVLEL